MPEGANATFTCSFSSKPEHFVLNWYRMSPSNQTDKLAAFPEDRSQPGRDRRFHVTPLPGGRHFHMSVMAAQRNDSGVYFCGAIYLPPKTQINESRPAELTVTGEGVRPEGRGEQGGVWAASRSSLSHGASWAGVARLHSRAPSHTQDHGDPRPWLCATGSTPRPTCP